MKLASGSPGWPIIMITRGSRGASCDERRRREVELRGTGGEVRVRVRHGRARRADGADRGHVVRRRPGLVERLGGVGARRGVGVVEVDGARGRDAEDRPERRVEAVRRVDAEERGEREQRDREQGDELAPPARVPEVPDGEGEPCERRGDPPPGGLVHRTAEQVEHVDRPPQHAGADDRAHDEHDDRGEDPPPPRPASEQVDEHRRGEGVHGDDERTVDHVHAEHEIPHCRPLAQVRDAHSVTARPLAARVPRGWPAGSRRGLRRPGHATRRPRRPGRP